MLRMMWNVILENETNGKMEKSTAQKERCGQRARICLSHLNRIFLAFWKRRKWNVKKQNKSPTENWRIRKKRLDITRKNNEWNTKPICQQKHKMPRKMQIDLIFSTLFRFHFGYVWTRLFFALGNKHQIEVLISENRSVHFSIILFLSWYVCCSVAVVVVIIVVTSATHFHSWRFYRIIGTGCNNTRCNLISKGRNKCRSGRKKST